MELKRQISHSDKIRQHLERLFDIMGLQQKEEEPTMKEELKDMICKMTEGQFEWFIDQAREVLTGGASLSDPPKGCPQNQEIPV